MKRITANNTVLEAIPREYQQEHTKVENSCVWLAACLVVRSENTDLASILLTTYKSDPKKFEWLHMFNKNALSATTLHNLFRHEKKCRLNVCHLNVPEIYKHMSLTDYILNHRHQGLIVAMLEDTTGGNSHTVGINLKLKLIYNCQESLF